MDGSNSEASTTSPRVPKIHDFKDDSDPVIAPKSAHNRDGDTFFRGHPYWSANAVCVQRQTQEDCPMLHPNSSPYSVPVPRKDSLDSVTLQENLDTRNLRDKHNYNNELKSSPDSMPLRNNMNPHIDLVTPARRPMNQQFQNDYYGHTQPSSQYSSRPPYHHARSLHLNTQVQQMPPRKPRIEHWNSLPPRNFYPPQPCLRSSANSICLLPSRALSPRRTNDRRFEDSESGKYESESTSQSSRTGLLHSFPSKDAPK